MQDSLLEASAKELLRTDLLNILLIPTSSYIVAMDHLLHVFTHTGEVRKFSLHSLRLDHTEKFSLSCLFHETFSI
jgi:hypothetical protein